MGTASLASACELTKVLFPLIIIACFEESWQIPDEYSLGDIETMLGVKYVDQVITDYKSVSFFLCLGKSWHDKTRPFCNFPEPGHCPGKPWLLHWDMPSVRSSLSVCSHVISSLPGIE